MKYTIYATVMPKKMNKESGSKAERKYSAGSGLDESQVLGVMHDEWMRYRKISWWMKFEIQEES